MKPVNQFLLIFTSLALLLVIYELLITPTVPTVTVRETSSLFQQADTLEKSNPLSQLVGERVDSGKHTLRQLLQDEEITRLPVRIITNCHNSVQSIHNKLSVDPDVVCLNESKLYRDSYTQYGMAFGELSLLQQKASIVRAVLFDLEQRKIPEARAKSLLQVQNQDFNRLQNSNQPFSTNLELINQHVSDSEDESYNYNENQNADSVELNNKNIREIRNSVTQKNITKQSLQPIYFPRAHPPPQLQNMQIHGQNLPLQPPSKKSKKEKKLPSKMNPDLIKLKGAKVRQTYDLAVRGFSTEWNVRYPIVRDRIKFISMAVNSTRPSERSVTGASMNPDLLARAKFQHNQVSHFCRQHTHPPPTLPLENTELDSIFQHLLYDDSRKIVFCYVPKNGCSNMKRLMLVLNGILPPDASQMKRPDEIVLKQVHSFRNLTHDEALYRLENYFKFAIVRNPLERLLSAYKNKLEPPFNVELRKLFPERLKAFILKSYRRQDFEAWIARNQSTEDIHLSFDEFVQFMNTYPLTAYNEHFRPFLELCNPCAVNFDLYLSFKSLEYDIYALLDYLNIPVNLYPESKSRHYKPVSEYMEEYYSKVTPSNKAALFRRFSREFDFYTSIHPEERGFDSLL